MTHNVQNQAAELEHMRWLVAVLAGELSRAWCAGSEACLDRFKRQRHPQPGDLVVETSTHYFDNHPWYGDRVGRLIAVRYETTDPDCEPERVWYIALSDGDVHRWVNADFVRVPDFPEFTRPIPERKEKT